MQNETNRPGPRCSEYVDGGLMSWPCRLELGHEGPHEAVEVPVSSRRREMWFEEQHKAKMAKSISETAAASTAHTDADIASMLASPTAAAPTRDVVALSPSVVNDEAARIVAILRVLGKTDIRELPSPVAAWAMGMLAQTSLLVLWEVAMREFDNGATSVSLNREFVERIVPATLRSYLGR